MPIIALLAAGAGSRFLGHGHKLSSQLLDCTVIEQSIARALASGIGPVVVVTGAVADIVPLELRDDVIIVHNAAWADGQSTSVQAGVSAARDLHATSVVIGLGDQPFIEPTAWRCVAEADGPIAVATYDGVRGNPVKLESSIWDLLPTRGDVGARDLMRVRPDLVREVPCIGSPADIDTEEDLRRWQNN